MWVKKLNPHHKVILYATLLTGPAAMLAIEFGWFLTELGRQPWIVRGFLKVQDAATNANGLVFVTMLFAILYFVLLFSATYVLVRMFKNKAAYEDIERIARSRGEL